MHGSCTLPSCAHTVVLLAVSLVYLQMQHWSVGCQSYGILASSRSHISMLSGSSDKFGEFCSSCTFRSARRKLIFNYQAKLIIIIEVSILKFLRIINLSIVDMGLHILISEVSIILQS